jgi:GxxExxY protein
MEVYNELGFGFLEKVYENALMVLLHRAGIKAKQQAPVKVKFQGTIVGDYLVDILVEEKIIVELKSSESIVDAHVAQVLNYLKATKLKLGIVLNFGKEKLEYKRIVL